MSVKLSPAMEKALRRALTTSGYVVVETTDSTRRALVARELAEVLYGDRNDYTRSGRYRGHLYNVATGVRLNDKGIEVAREIVTRAVDNVLGKGTGNVST